MYADSAEKGMDTLVNLAMVLLITAGVLINVFVLFVSLSSPERETNFFGVIPFVFHTESMEPQIMYNDLAFFDAIDKQEHCMPGIVFCTMRMTVRRSQASRR